ncbi:Kinesin-like protein KIF26B, partial [Stegodyphus mimosarum]
MLRIKGDSGELNSSFLNVDARKKQVTVYDLSSGGGQSSPAERRAGISAPKMFAFDAIFSPDDTQAEVCSSSLPEVIQAVVGGTDGCLFVYGHSKLASQNVTACERQDVTEDHQWSSRTIITTFSNRCSIDGYRLLSGTPSQGVGLVVSG